jgi:hypothetical protein
MDTRTLNKSEYLFDASMKTISFKDDDLEQRNIVLITNLTVDNTIIYNFACSDVGGTMADDVLTLDYGTNASMNDSDDLVIIIEDTGDILSELKEIKANTRFLLNDLIEQQKITNKHLEQITEVDFNVHNIEK